MREMPRERPIVASAQHPGLADALHFEHLVQINDPDDPRVAPMRREQLWRGLVMRAQFPASFVPWLDDCSIEQDGADLLRTLRFGSQVVHDRVHFDGEDAVDYTVTDDDDGSSFRMSMRIEQPTLDALFVRFTYESWSPDHHAGDPHIGAVREAYRLADIDTVFRIRQLADSGLLDD
ncbi:MAG TPA: AtaL-like protein [Xanthomonadaceae bacterium]